MFDIVIGMIGYMKQHDYGDYVREELIDQVLERVLWAQRAKQSQVAFLVFWWLYTTWDDYVEMTHDIERAANPLSSSSQELSYIKLFALNRLQAFCSSPYLPCNVNLLIESMRKAFLLGAHHRLPSILQSQPLDPTRVDKEDRVPPLMFLVSQAEQEFTVRMRKTVAEYVRQINWDPPPSVPTGTLAIRVTAYDASGAESIV